MGDLVSRARRGDKAAFEQLYRDNAGRIYAVCLRLSADAGHAEELTQDVFVRAWQKLETFRGDSAFSTWLHRIAVNTVFQWQRSENRRSARLAKAGSLAATPTSAARPALQLDLERAIARLPAGARSVFVMHDIEGYKHAEIAAITGLAVGTLKAQLHRARKLLREALER